MIVILVNIRSLHNVGSIFRTADAAGIEKIYLTGYTPTPIDQFGARRPQIAKVALGAETYIPWEYHPSSTALIDRLKKGGFKILAVEQSKTSVLFNQVKLKSKEKVALIMGNEVKGLPPTILKRADQILEIPMLGKKESLNVSVAFGIVVYGLLNKLISAANTK
jgi:23S rRNA (guanosine2251-2'-O)-methyltransferase